jgi:hypothetical protein
MIRKLFYVLAQTWCLVGFLATVALILPCVPAAIGGGYRDRFGEELPPLAGAPIILAATAAASFATLCLFEWVGTAMAADPQTGKMRGVRRTLCRAFVCVVLIAAFFGTLGLASTVRSMAVRVLWLGGRHSLPLLERALDDRGPLVRRSALDSLADLGDDARPLVSRIRHALHDDNEQVRWAAERALQRLERGNR